MQTCLEVEVSLFVVNNWKDVVDGRLVYSLVHLQLNNLSAVVNVNVHWLYFWISKKRGNLVW